MTELLNKLNADLTYHYPYDYIPFFNNEEGEQVLSSNILEVVIKFSDLLNLYNEFKVNFFSSYKSFFVFKEHKLSNEFFIDLEKTSFNILFDFQNFLTKEFCIYSDNQNIQFANSEMPAINDIQVHHIAFYIRENNLPYMDNLFLRNVRQTTLAFLQAFEYFSLAGIEEFNNINRYNKANLTRLQIEDLKQLIKESEGNAHYAWFLGASERSNYKKEVVYTLYLEAFGFKIPSEKSYLIFLAYWENFIHIFKMSDDYKGQFDVEEKKKKTKIKE